MHEASLVRALLRQVDEVRVAHGGGRVREVRVQLGPLSGVEPLLVAEAFVRLRGECPALATATLALDEVPLLVRCSACGHEFEPAAFKFRCSACDSSDTEIIRGDGVLLDGILLDDAPQGVSA